MDDATKAILGVAVLQVSKTVREFLRDKKARAERAEQREKLNKALLQLDVRLDLVENRTSEALEHSASLNRKKWREQHPGKDTPDPTLEPRTNYREKKP